MNAHQRLAADAADAGREGEEPVGPERRSPRPRGRPRASGVPAPESGEGGWKEGEAESIQRGEAYSTGVR